MKKLSKKIYGVILFSVLVVITIAMIDGWQTWLIPSQRIHQIACLVAIREHFLENSLMAKNADNLMVINTDSIPLESLADVPFFCRQNYRLDTTASETKPKKNKIVLVYNSDYLNPSVDWIAIAMGRKNNLILSKDGTTTTTEDIKMYLKQPANTTYYIYGKIE